MWSKIKSLDYSFPESFDDDARNLVQKFLVSVVFQSWWASRTDLTLMY